MASLQLAAYLWQETKLDGPGEPFFSTHRNHPVENMGSLGTGPNLQILDTPINDTGLKDRTSEVEELRYYEKIVSDAGPSGLINHERVKMYALLLELAQQVIARSPPDQLSMLSEIQILKTRIVYEHLPARDTWTEAQKTIWNTNQSSMAEQTEANWLRVNEHVLKGYRESAQRLRKAWERQHGITTPQNATSANTALPTGTNTGASGDPRGLHPHVSAADDSVSTIGRTRSAQRKRKAASPLASERAKLRKPDDSADDAATHTTGSGSRVLSTRRITRNRAARVVYHPEEEDEEEAASDDEDMDTSSDSSELSEFEEEDDLFESSRGRRNVNRTASRNAVSKTEPQDETEDPNLFLIHQTSRVKYYAVAPEDPLLRAQFDPKDCPIPRVDGEMTKNKAKERGWTIVGERPSYRSSGRYYIKDGNTIDQADWLDLKFQSREKPEYIVLRRRNAPDWNFMATGGKAGEIALEKFRKGEEQDLRRLIGAAENKNRWSESEVTWLTAYITGHGGYEHWRKKVTESSGELQALLALYKTTPFDGQLVERTNNAIFVKLRRICDKGLAAEFAKKSATKKTGKSASR